MVRPYWGYADWREHMKHTLWPMNSLCGHPIRPPANGGSTSTHYCQSTFASKHEGGAFFLMCDGQVRFLSENLDMRVWRGLSTIANNEVLDDEDF